MGLPSLGWLRLLTQPWCSIFSWWTFSLLFATELSSNSSTRAILVVATFYILGAKCARTSSTKVKRSREEEFWINSKIKKKCAIVHPHLGSSRSPTRFSLPIPRGCREGRFFRRLLCRSLSALNALIFFLFLLPPFGRRSNTILRIYSINGGGGRVLPNVQLVFRHNKFPMTWQWYFAKKEWFKAFIPSRRNGPNILDDHIWGYHCLLCFITK